jgi:hypothetical protein
MKNFKRVVNTVKVHGKCLLKGFGRMAFGAATAGMIALAVYGFVMVTTETGWTAVSDFVASTALMLVALSCTYAMGGHAKKGAKR